MFKKVIDKYLAYPVIIDIIIVVLVWICSKKLSLISFKLVDKSIQTNILSNIISTDVSLAGFILAALTIIVTFKSNLKARGIEDAENSLEMILSSKHYNDIVKVFTKSLAEFVLCFIFIFIAWITADNWTVQTLFRVNVTGIILTSFAIIRSLSILFLILGLGNK